MHRKRESKLVEIWTDKSLRHWEKKLQQFDAVLHRCSWAPPLHSCVVITSGRASRSPRRGCRCLPHSCSWGRAWQVPVCQVAAQRPFSRLSLLQTAEFTTHPGVITDIKLPPSRRLPTRCIVAIANLSRTWGEFYQRVNLTLHLPSTTRGCCKAIVPVNGEQRAVKVMRKVIRVKTKVDGPQMKTGRFRVPGERQVSII